MGWQNPPVPWRQLERVMSDRQPEAKTQDDIPEGNGGDSPAWSRKRVGYVPPNIQRVRSNTSYAELHTHSCFSFLDGASAPERLVEEAVRSDLTALAITDHNGFYGVVRFAEAARKFGMPTVFGAELTLDKLDVSHQRINPAPDPDGTHLVVLARDPIGYAALARVISEAQLSGEKGAPLLSMSDFDRWLKPGESNHWKVLTGCRKGAVPRTLERQGTQAATDELRRLVEQFGRDNVAVELWDHAMPADSERNERLFSIAKTVGVETVATNNVHYATVSDRRLATAMAAVRARRSLDEMVSWMPSAGTAHIRSGDEQARRFRRFPGVVETAARFGQEFAFDLSLVAPNLPPFTTPNQTSEMEYLRQLVTEGATKRYGTRSAPRLPGAWAQLDYELDLIEKLDFPGYFLVVWDIVEFCRRSNIFCQGRGSAANSAVCYVLGVTKADAVELGLLFERFLSPERDGPPDIDLDIESDRREEVIQYVYDKHGRRHAAQVANVITYRPKSAVRDAAKALGYSVGQQDAFSKSLDRWASLRPKSDSSDEASNGAARAARQANENVVSELPLDVIELAMQFDRLPRHLGIHSGGMVMCDRPVTEVCPVEPARMANRTVLQWDKEDCAAVGLVKFDLLGLGMLSALHYTVDIVANVHGTVIDLAEIEQEEAVYNMLGRADTIGVFQVESRAQMATLPRLKPRTFYDLVVEVALIRPGPIQGGSVHPYIKRRNGQEPITYLHPSLEPALKKTLGVPIFQEQMMQIAIDVAGFSAADADQLRQAMASKRSAERMDELKERFFAGMQTRGVETDVQPKIWDKLSAFANFGFPESHSISFAYLVYSSSWLKLHYPAAYCAGLLQAQPMGFYSPHSLVQDARRHGVPTYTPDINLSEVEASVEAIPDGVAEPPIDIAGAEEIFDERYDHGWAVRMGIGSVRYVGSELAGRIVEERSAGGDFKSIEDVARRIPVPVNALEALATAGAFDQFDTGIKRKGNDGRRQALWQAGAIAAAGAGSGDKLEGIVTGVSAPQLPGMSDHEESVADMWATGVAANGHPTKFFRRQLEVKGVVPANRLNTIADGDKVVVAGVVTHRQRPATASGVTFLNLEDETGLINIVVSVGCWARYEYEVRNASAMLVKGRLECHESVINISAEKFEVLAIGPVPASRDFR